MMPLLNWLKSKEAFQIQSLRSNANEPREPAPSRFPAAVFAALAVAALVTLIGGISPGSLAPWAVSP